MVSVLFTALAMIATGQVGPDRLDRYGTAIIEGVRRPRESLVRSDAPERRRRSAA